MRWYHIDSGENYDVASHKKKRKKHSDKARYGIRQRMVRIAKINKLSIRSESSAL